MTPRQPDDAGDYVCLDCGWIGPMDDVDDDGKCPECHKGQFTLHRDEHEVEDEDEDEDEEKAR